MLAGKTNCALTWNTGCVPPNILALVVLKSFHLSNCWRSTKLIITQSKVKLCNDMASKYTTFTGCYSWPWSVKLPCQNSTFMKVHSTPKSSPDLSRLVAATFQAKFNLAWFVAATFQAKVSLSWIIAATFQDKLRILWNKQVFCRFYSVFRAIFCF